MNKIKDQILSSINDNEALTHVFIVILFFENYTMIAQHDSLLNTNNLFETLSPQPFILFFVFIFLSKVCWVPWQLAIGWIKFKASGTDNDSVYQKISVKAFMLFILLTSYLIMITSDDGLSPVSQENHPFWFRVFFSIPLATAITCFIISCLDINYSHEHSSKKEFII